MSDDLEIRPIFMLGQALDGPFLVVGITQGGWEHMRAAGESMNLDLTRSTGIPLRLEIFACPDHDTGMKWLQKQAAAAGVPILDERRRRDFGIKDPSEGGT